MHTLPFQNRLAPVSVSISIALAILLSAFPLATCAQDVPRKISEVKCKRSLFC
jgi:hypothetical protein